MPGTHRQDSTAAAIAEDPTDAGLEDPDPSSTLAGQPRGRVPACAAAVVPFGMESMVVDIDAQVSLPWTFAALAAAALACFGAIVADSLLAYSPTRLAQRLDELRRADRERLTAELDQRDQHYFVVATIYAAAGWVLGLWALTRAIDPGNLAWALALWVGLMLFGCGGLPTVIVERRSERTVLTALPALRFGFYALRYPLIEPLLRTTQLFARALRLQAPAKDDPTEVQKQVMAAVADNVDQAELADAERAWIGNIVTLKDLQVSTVMTPRPDIVALSESMTLREAVDQALEHEFSRYPVYRERIDDVVGVFYVKDALRLLQSSPSQSDETTLRALLREPLFVPETTGAAQLLRRMQTGNQHMAIVIDEYGTTAGLATVEDLIEEIVGEIEDEYDPPSSEQGEDQVRVVEVGRVVEIPARTSVLDLNKLIGAHVSDEGDWETVAGLVIAACNRIPSNGETVVVDDVEFRVLEADERRVQRLRVTALAPHGEAEAGP